MMRQRQGWNDGGDPATRESLSRYWRELAELAAVMPIDVLTGAADLLLACQARGRVVFVAGNGGSAATASHLACDLAKGTRPGGVAAFRVMPLTDNVPLITAWANDTAYSRVFAEQLAALARPGDILVAISASGTSPNIVAAAETAAELGVTVLALTGKTGGRLAAMADLSVRVPSDRIELVEDAHLAIGHSLCVALRERLAADVATREADQVVLQARPVEAMPVDLSA
jgi:D-sedoheptulose 7-phosphate isomerase